MTYFIRSGVGSRSCREGWLAMAVGRRLRLWREDARHLVVRRSVLSVHPVSGYDLPTPTTSAIGAASTAGRKHTFHGRHLLLCSGVVRPLFTTTIRLLQPVKRDGISREQYKAEAREKAHILPLDTKKHKERTPHRKSKVNHKHKTNPGHFVLPSDVRHWVGGDSPGLE